MDQLVYSYDSGNKLEKVVDNSNNVLGFKDGTNAGNDYSYDANGNMTSDENKNISNIKYNHFHSYFFCKDKYWIYIYQVF